MKKSEITPGMIVWLKSGGPEMVVKGISHYDGLWICNWFDKNKSFEHTYSSEQLVDINPSKAAKHNLTDEQFAKVLQTLTDNKSKD